ncbi:isochorismatase family protein [Agrococcus sp. SL85]|uniref:isochorismatase family protein n=1 Tax=Agrococcus sp. SL85 TaxID=2995141 RepID=UPI00226CC3CB|nr:isochorismatase family protein [Agrococcus sp. SL85]WAC65932.1 isochorismatase family protein [Agrococcus sp. SL85]
MRAILAIDVQESFRARAAEWAEVSAPDIAERVQRVVDHGRASGDAIVWVLHEEPGSGGPFDAASGHVRLQPGVAPAAHDLRVTKRVHSAFGGTDLDARLRALGVDEVVVTGIRTEQCCETTARAASDLGYAVTVVLDATATHPHAAWGGGTISAAEIQRATASALQDRFATVTTLDAFLA